MLNWRSALVYLQRMPNGMGSSTQTVHDELKKVKAKLSALKAEKQSLLWELAHRDAKGEGR